MCANAKQSTYGTNVYSLTRLGPINIYRMQMIVLIIQSYFIHFTVVYIIAKTSFDSTFHSNMFLVNKLQRFE